MPSKALVTIEMMMSLSDLSMYQTEKFYSEINNDTNLWKISVFS